MELNVIAYLQKFLYQLQTEENFQTFITLSAKSNSKATDVQLFPSAEYNRLTH